ncbi:MAG: ribonuclease P protein component [Myxococcota bacterium]
MHRTPERGGGPTRAGQGLGRADRLRKRFEFRQAQLRGRRVHTPHFLIVVQPNSAQKTRLGITVTKKVGNAVERNRIKRVVREVFRRNRALFPAKHDIVFIAKRGAEAIGYEALLTEVRHASGKLARRKSR